jgi:general secretion pathway protein A
MYLGYYELQQYPFRTNPDPAFLWFGEKHREALALLQYGIMKRDGFLLLTGDVGTGKTSLLRYLLSTADASTVIATLTDPMMPVVDLYNLIAADCGLGRKYSGKADFLMDFKQYLLQAHADRKNVFLIIDEAQRLDPVRLEEVRLLSNIELNDRKLINIFFVGQTETEDHLMDPRNKAIRQRISMSYRLEPLNARETQHYIAHRLKVAGAKRGIFSLGACTKIHEIAEGIPRLINSICDCALLSGYAKNHKIVDSRLIRECQLDLRIPIGRTGE